MTIYAENLLDAIHEPVVLLGKSLELRSVNRAYTSTFKLSRKPIPGTALAEFHGGAWDRPEIRSMLERVIAQQSASDDHEMAIDFPQIGRCSVLVSARWFLFGSGQESVLVAVHMA